MLNKTPILDKGYAALVSTSLPRKSFKMVQMRFFRGNINSRLLETPQLHLEIKCPLFVQLALTERGLCAVSLRDQKAEAYVPTVDQVGTADLKTSEAIQKDIEQTTNALTLNPKSYQMDGCDMFVSQVISPISMYNTILVSGSLQDWISFTSRKDLPKPIDMYRQAIADIILAEYDFLWEFVNGKKKV